MTKLTYKQQLRKRFGSQIQSLGFVTGIMALNARIRDITGTTIIMYHSVADDNLSPWVDPANHVSGPAFKRQMRFLPQKKHVISLTDLIKRLQQNTLIEKNTVVITFDDGYLDNLTVAAPILDQYGFKATIFLPTSYIDRSETQWIDQVYCIFKYRTKSQLVWNHKNKSFTFNLQNPIEHKSSYQEICSNLISATPSERLTILDSLQDQLHPSSSPPRLTMNWDEVRTLVNVHKCFEIGGHTTEHTDLTSVSSKAARQELLDCSQQIEHQLGFQPRHFSFCYGRTSEALRKITPETGFESACGGDGLDPVIQTAADLFRLPRVAAPQSIHQFKLLTSSANTGIWRKLGK